MLYAASLFVALGGSPLLPTFHRDSPRRLLAEAGDVNRETQDVVVKRRGSRAIGADLVVAVPRHHKMWDGQAPVDLRPLAVGPGGDNGGRSAAGGGPNQAPDGLGVRGPEPGARHVGVAPRVPRWRRDLALDQVALPAPSQVAEGTLVAGIDSLRSLPRNQPEARMPSLPSL